jgi:cytochrome c553
MKSKWLAFLLVLMLVGFAAWVVGAAEQQKTPDTVTLQSTLWPQVTKGPVTLDHKKHNQEYKVACAECHHVYKDGKNVWKEGDPVKKCQECHNEPTIQMEKKLPPDQQKLNLKLAFHNNCQECHKKYKKDHADSKIPVTCAGCHPKGGAGGE